MKKRLSVLFGVAFLALSSDALSSATDAEEVDLAVINRIKDEAFQRSQVMEYAHQLADVIGPRLAASPSYRRAASWAVETFRGMGVEKARLEPWGTFGRSWSYTRVAVEMIEPSTTTLTGVPLAWTAGTRGPVEAPVVLAPLWPDPEDSDRGDLVRL